MEQPVMLGTTEPPAPVAPDPTCDARWDDLQRVEAWAGEARVNLVRVVALVVFYGHLLFRARWQGEASAGGDYLLVVTLVVGGWTALVMGLQRALAARFLPGWLGYAVVSVDLVLVSLLLMAGSGPRSPLVVLYLLVVASTALRLCLGLVRFATLTAFVLYLAVVAFVIEFSPQHRIAHPDQVVFMVSLLLTGGLAGQSVRQARRLVAGLPVQVEEPS